MSRPETPSQTAGPYVHIGLVPCHAQIDGVYPADLGSGQVRAEGPPLDLCGSIYDGAGARVTDALIEIWQADADGSAGLWARRTVDGPGGTWRLQTVRPGPVTCADGTVMAPHLTIWIVARGINTGLRTRVYLPDDDLSADPVVARVPEARRRTLIAAPDGLGYRFDIHLQGPSETVFFDA